MVRNVKMNSRNNLLNILLLIIIVLFIKNCGWAGFNTKSEKDKNSEKNILISAGILSSSSSSTSQSSSSTSLSATITPSDQTTDVSVSGGISIVFNKDINKSTIHSNTIYLKQGSSTISGSITIAGSNAAVFVPSSNLNYNTTYTLTVTTGVTDNQGPPQSLSTNVTSTFTTQADTVLPTVSLISPSNNSSSISTNTSIFISFNKSMAASTLNTTNITLLNGATPVTGTVSTFGSTGAYFTPSSALSNSTTYTVNISTGVTDSNSVALASSYSSNFTTSAAPIDSIAPTVTSSNPSNGATGVAISQTILVTFSEAILSSTINSTNITLTQGVTPIAGTVYPAGSNGAVFQPTSSLAYNTSYTLTLTTGITDTAGTPNSLGNTTISFTTIADSTSFAVSSVNPSNTTTNVPINSGIIITFNKAVDSSTLIAANISLTASGSSSSNLLTITPIGNTSVLLLSNTNMVHSTLHVLQLTSGIKDSLGNALTGVPYTSLFTTFNSDPDSGTVTTLAGTGSAGNVNGTGVAASFSSPQHLVMNIAEDTLYVTDTGNHRIRTIGAANGLVSTAAGSTLGYTAGTGVAARFNSPKGIFRTAVNGVELFFISDSGNNGIRRMTSANVVTNNYGTNSSAAGFVISTSATAQRYRNPEGFSVNFVTGHQFTVDTGNHCIRRSTSANTGASNTSPNTSCFAGASPSGGLGTSGFVNGALTTARFNSPKGIAIDSIGNIFISDSGNHSIRMITPGGVVSTIAGSGSSGYANGSGIAATFNNPTDIVVDGDNTLYVADGGNCSIRKLVLNSAKTSAVVTTYAGATPDITVSKCGFINSTRLVSRFNNPTGLWLASNKKLYVTDTGNHSIRVIEN